MSTDIRLKRTSDGSTYISNNGIVNKGEPFYDSNSCHLFIGNQDGEVLKNKKHLAEASPVGSGVYQLGEDTSNVVITNTVGYLVFEYDSDDYTAKLVGVRECTPHIKSLVIPDTVIYNGDTYHVTTIGNAALSEMSVEEIIVPDAITEIGEGAFDCADLTRISLPYIGGKKSTSTNDQSVCLGYVFHSVVSSDNSGCSHYTYERDEVTYYCTFALPQTLKEVEIRDISTAQTGSLACIGASVSLPGHDTNPTCSLILNGCAPLNIEPFAHTTDYLGDVAYFDNVKFVRHYNDDLLNASDNTLIVIGEMNIAGVYSNVVDIDRELLQNIGISGCYVESMTIKASTFANASSLDFSNNPALESVLWDVEHSVNVSTSPFRRTWDEGWSDLPSVIHTEVTITIGKSVKNIPDALLWIMHEEDYHPIRHVNIDGDIQSIGNHAFYGCYSLKTINDDGVLPDSLTSVGDYAFSGCSSLSSLHIPLHCLMGDGTIAGCFRLKKLTIPHLDGQLSKIEQHTVSKYTVDGNDGANQYVVDYPNKTVNGEPLDGNSMFNIKFDTNDEGTRYAEWMGHIALEKESVYYHEQLNYYLGKILIHVYEGDTFVVEEFEGTMRIVTTPYFVAKVTNNTVLTIYPNGLCCPYNSSMHSTPMPLLTHISGDIRQYLRYKCLNSYDSAGYEGPSINIEEIRVVDDIHSQSTDKLVWYGARYGYGMDVRPDVELPDLETWRIGYVTAEDDDLIYMTSLTIRGGRYWNCTGTAREQLYKSVSLSNVTFINPPPIKLIDLSSMADTTYGMISYLVD